MAVRKSTLGLESLSDELDELNTRLLEVEALIQVMSAHVLNQGAAVSAELAGCGAVQSYALNALSREILRIHADLDSTFLLRRHGLSKRVAEVANG